MKWWDQLKETTADMTVKQKVEHIVRYYWVFLLGIAIVLFGGIYVAVHVHNANQGYSLYVCFVNADRDADLGEMDRIQKAFEMKSGLAEEKKPVIFDTNFYFELNGNKTTGKQYYQKAIALIEAETADALIMDRDNLENLGRRGWLIDLNNKKTAFLLEKYPDRVITVTATIDGKEEEVPVGFDLSDCFLVTEKGIYPETCCIGLSERVPNPEAVEQLIDFLLE